MPDQRPVNVNRAIALIALIVFVDFLGFSLVLPFLPVYARRFFGASGLITGAIISTFSVFQLFAAPVLGQMSDRFGRRPVLLVTLLGSALGFLTLAAAQWVHNAVASTGQAALATQLGVALLFLARAINGATGGNLPVAQAYLADITHDEQRAHALGAVSTAMVVALGIGPLLAGQMVQRNDFTMPALLATALSVGSAVLCWWLLPESRRPGGPTADSATEQREVAAVLDGDATPLTASESRLGNILPTLRRPEAGSLLMAWFLFILCFAMIAPMFPIIATTNFGLGVRRIGYLFTMLAVLAVVWQVFILGRLTKRFNDRQLAMMGLSAITFCFVLAAFYGGGPLGRKGVPVLVVLTVIFGLGFAAARPAITSALTKLGSQTQAGVVMGVAQSLDSIAYALGPVITGTLLDFTSLRVVGAVATGFGLLATGLVWLGRDGRSGR